MVSESASPLPTLFEEALALRQAGRLAEAIAVYRRVEPGSPDYFKALNNLGVLLENTNRPAEAVAVYRRAMAIEPKNAGLLYNLAHALQAAGELEVAAVAYGETLALEPGLLPAHYNLGCTRFSLGRLEEAAAAFEQALRLDSEVAVIHSRLGNAYQDLGRLPEARHCYQRAVELSPGSAAELVDLGFAEEQLGETDAALARYRDALELDPRLTSAYEVLGRLLVRLERPAEAEEVFRRWRQACPDDAAARHMLAALIGEQVPDRAEPEYVRQAFDQFAERFDATLENLDYRAPQLVAAALGELLGPAMRDRVILDAGSGTGLCGPLLRPFARRLVGVDLSPEMSERAKRRGVYDELITSDLVEFFRETPERFDAIVAADTLNYFGNLEPVLAAAKFAVRAGGLLVFTLEAEASADHKTKYRLAPEGRYRHADDYVQKTLRETGWEIVALKRATLRLEHRQPVAGLVIRAKSSSQPG